MGPSSTMIIFGSRNRITDLDQGTFACPRCQTNQRFQRRLSRRWFTLYFMPIFPVESGTEFVECGLCASAWKPSVLQLPA